MSQARARSSQVINKMNKNVLSESDFIDFNFTCDNVEKYIPTLVVIDNKYI